MTSAEHQADTDPLLRKAINLFTFLGRTQQLLVRPVRNVSGFNKVMWFGDLPDHEAIWSAHRTAAGQVQGRGVRRRRVILRWCWFRRSVPRGWPPVRLGCR